ncbi:hypothetical protein MOE90_02105 [Bacillus spizizenii]|nr:hypothetical protein [Bacillus spizizenii]MCY9127430.1 hypothetical protein [Bacillus spizizenii]
MLSSLAIWYLRKKKKSVLIGYELKSGCVKALNNHALTYDNVFFDIDYRAPDDSPLVLPEGKCSIKRKLSAAKKEDE